MPSNRLRLIYKIIMLVMAIIAFGVGIYMLVALFSGNQNHFTKHFGISIISVLTTFSQYLTFFIWHTISAASFER